MDKKLKLSAIPKECYHDYRREIIFNAYKWDPQVRDSGTVSKHALLMEQDTALQLERWAEQLSAETMAIEEALLHKPAISKKLELPKKIFKILNSRTNYDRAKNVRLMRFDFHPTQEGTWALSEVNSDVPGGWAEAAAAPVIAAKYFEGFLPRKNVAREILNAFKKKLNPGATVALVHATSYADDRQVMQLLGDTLEAEGYNPLYTAPDNIKWQGGTPAGVDAIVRFYPSEWFENLSKKADWVGYFDCTVPSCNHPAALLTQSKRLPLVWDELGLDIPAWKALLPATKDPRDPDLKTDEWILKPVFGRVGEDISIKGTMPQKKLMLIEKAARKKPQHWVAQQKFNSRPLLTETGEQYHLCIGVLTVDGKSAGFYGRINPYPRIDENAQDIPILVRKENP